MRFFLCGAALSAALIGGVALATSAKASGLAGLHKQIQISDRICMVDHDHHGDSGAWATKELAASAAAWSWGSFTALEYGEEWGQFRLAEAQDMSCNPIAGERGQLWSCKAKATPCRPAHAPAQVAHLAPQPVAAPQPALKALPVAAPVVPRPPRAIEVRRLERRLVVRAQPIRTAHKAPHPRALGWPGDR